MAEPESPANPERDSGAALYALADAGEPSSVVQSSLHLLELVVQFPDHKLAVRALEQLALSRLRVADYQPTLRYLVRLAEGLEQSDVDSSRATAVLNDALVLAMAFRDSDVVARLSAQLLSPPLSQSLSPEYRFRVGSTVASFWLAKGERGRVRRWQESELALNPPLLIELTLRLRSARLDEEQGRSRRAQRGYHRVIRLAHRAGLQNPLEIGAQEGVRVGAVERGEEAQLGTNARLTPLEIQARISAAEASFHLTEPRFQTFLATRIEPYVGDACDRIGLSGYSQRVRNVVSRSFRELEDLQSGLRSVADFGSARWTLAALARSVFAANRLWHDLDQNLVCDEDGYDGAFASSASPFVMPMMHEAKLCVLVASEAHLPTPESCQAALREHRYRDREEQAELWGLQSWTNMIPAQVAPFSLGEVEVGHEAEPADLVGSVALGSPRSNENSRYCLHNGTFVHDSVPRRFQRQAWSRRSLRLHVANSPSNPMPVRACSP